MNATIQKALRDWNRNNNERTKLQQAYVVGALGLLVAAGLIGLINYDLGQQLTTVALITLGVFFINLVAWTLLHGLVLLPLSVKTESAIEKSSKPKPKKSQK